MNGAIRVLALAMLPSLLSGCGGSEIPDGGAASSAIRFASSVAESRGTLVESIPDGAAMSVSCIRKNMLDESYNYYFQNIDYTLSSASPGFVNGNIYWWWREADTEYNFYAFYPAQSTGIDYTGNGPKLTYTAARDGSSPDILAAEGLGYGSDYENVVALSFHHLLSGVRFKLTATTPAGQITGLQLQSLAFTASYCNGSWGDYTNNNNTTVKAFAVTGNGQEQLIPATGYEYMLLPQTGGASTCLTLTYTDSYPQAGYVHQFTMPLSGFTFEAGKGYTFVIDGTLTQITVNCVEDTTGAIMDRWTTHIFYSEDIPAERNPYQTETTNP